MRTTSCSTSGSTGGLPGTRRCFEPSNLWATALRYHARIVSGLATQATCRRAFRPSRLPISASIDLCASDSLNATIVETRTTAATACRHSGMRVRSEGCSYLCSALQSQRS